MKSSHKSENKIKGIRIGILVNFLIAVELICFVMTIWVTKKADNYYQQMEQSISLYFGTEDAIRQIKEATEDLTKYVRHAVDRGSIDNIKDYIEEINVRKRREKGIEQIKSLIADGDTKPLTYMEIAVRKSDQLIEREIQAMAYAAYYYKLDISKLPPEIANCHIDKKFQNMNRTDQRNYLEAYVNGRTYKILCDSIEDNIEIAEESVQARLMQQREQQIVEYAEVIKHQSMLLMISLGGFIVMAFSIILLILHPISRDVESIRQDEMLPVGETYELNYLAKAYNDSYVRNITAKKKLKEQAEKDGLTGLLNRAAYNNLTEILSKVPDPMVLYLIDVDYFKGVNDTYGHKVGDLALKKVADVMLETFRSNDYCIRFGGDEFAVIMLNIEASQKQIIEMRARTINEMLQMTGDDGVPALSVSIGAAYSEKGFTDELFKNADAALYETKERGRKGHTIRM